LSLLLTTKAATGKKNFFAFLFIFVWSKVRIQRVFYFYTVTWHQYSGKVGSQYTVSRTLLFKILPTKNYKQKFKFVKVISQNIVSVFHHRYNDKGIFDDVIITSALRSDIAIYGENISTSK